MDKYRIAFTRENFDDDGEFAVEHYDIASLREHPDIEIRMLANPEHVDAGAIVGVDALVSSPMAAAITRDSFPPDCRLAVIARLGVGYEDVDVDACTANHVALAIATDAVRRPTAVGALALLLAVTINLLHKDRISRLGPPGWAQRADYAGVGLVGKTLGIVGLGSIGAELARLAAPLDLKFIAYDPYADPSLAAELGVRLVDDLDALMAEADFVSIHCLVTPETRGLIDARRLALMKPSAFLINAARGPVVDQKALTETLAARRIAGAGLDVFETEPPAAADPLLALDNVVLSAHAMNWTVELMAAFGETNVRALRDVMHGRAPRSVVNAEVLESPEWRRKTDALRARFGAE